MSPFQKFIVNIGWTTLGKAGVQIILFAISILLTRYLGKERLGDYATLLVIPVFIRLLTSFGFETLVNKKLPEILVQDSSGAEGRYLIGRLLIFRFVTTTVFCFLIYHFLLQYLDFINNSGLIEFRWALIFYFFVITVDSFLSTLLMTLLRFKTLAKTETLGALLNLVLLIIFIRLDYGIYAVLYAYIISIGIMSVIYLIVARDQYLGVVKKPELDDMGNLAWVSYGIGFLGFGLMTQSDVLLMNYFEVGRADIGLYHLATGLGAAMAFLLTGVAPMALSLFSETYAKDGIKSLENLYCQIVGFAAYLTIPVYVFCVLNASLLIDFIYGETFLEGTKALATYAAFAGIQTALGINFTVSTLYVIRRRDVAIRSTAESSIINIALNMVLIPNFGMMGAVMATGFSMLYMICRQLKVVSTEMDIAPVFSIIRQCFVFCLIASVPTLILSGLDQRYLMINLPVYLIGLVALLIIVKPFSDKQRQFVLNVYPKLDNWSKWFFRTSGN